ncbi:hypothetical protein [Sphaerochaeta sp. PS]|uniref:hypothetical protein n=1 Tax=Sphaerochaeta sp. PS TaxID=3076336 RepID=UPI0028A3157C|nr:hypothetical protein [Sphaerochaeta sp. PS]MDT4761815.1 hypothetical protein [Sphaerochaeta sp. PS]
MAILATGQITFIDYNDALSLTGFINSTHPKTQVFSKDGGGKWSADWATANNLLTPNVFRQAAGASGLDLVSPGGGNGVGITNPKWTLKLFTDTAVVIAAGASNAAFGSVGSAAPYTLTLNKNCMTEAKPSLECTFSCTYTDPSTALSIDFKTSVTFSLMKSGGKAVFVQIFEDNGQYVIRNGSVATSTLALKFSVYRNGVKDTSVTGSAQWKYRDPGGNWTNDGTAVALSNSNPETAATKTISAATVDAITNSRTYRIEFTDNDSEADVTGTVYSAEVSILDLTDPFQVEYSVDGGTIFKNGEGTKTIRLRLFQNGSEIDLVSGAYKLYRLTLHDQNGNITYFKSAYDLATSISGAIAVGATSLVVASAGTGAKAIKEGDRLVLEPGVGAKEEIVQVGASYVSGTTIPLVSGVQFAHAASAPIKSANKKCGLTDTAKVITITGDDIFNLGSTDIEVLA